MGVSIVRPGQSADALRGEADAALYEAKRRGGKGVSYFEDISEHVVITTSDERDAAHRLIDEGGVMMAYQPIWNLATGELIGVEALARRRRLVPDSGPSEAFDVAERIGRVHEPRTRFASGERSGSIRTSMPARCSSWNPLAPDARPRRRRQ